MGWLKDLIDNDNLIYGKNLISKKCDELPWIGETNILYDCDKDGRMYVWDQLENSERYEFIMMLSKLNYCSNCEHREDKINSMKAQNYINVVDILNNEICDVIPNALFYFEYSYGSYVDNISFAGRSIYNTENDESVETETELIDILREKVLIFTNQLMK